MEIDEILKQITDIVAKQKSNAHGRFQLPTERQLAQDLNVQRLTIRERLAVLESLGLVERVQGSGTYLSLPRSTFVQMYFEMALKLDYITIDELRQSQHMIEREIASAAALQATPEDIADIKNALARMVEAHDEEEAIETQYEFHLCLAKASHNSVIVLLIEGLAQVLRHVLRRRQQLIHMIPGATARNNETHRVILNAIQNRDPEQAAMAIDEHFWEWDRESSKISMLYLSEDDDNDDNKNGSL